jgi:hypothetical protein
MKYRVVSEITIDGITSVAGTEVEMGEAVAKGLLDLGAIEVDTSQKARTSKAVMPTSSAMKEGSDA